MQKQFLINTLLLIGALCLSTRGIAQTEHNPQQDNQQQITTSAQPEYSAQNSHPVDTTAAQNTNLMNTMPTYTSTPQDDANEDMD